ncbi:MAG: hypothetical protein R2708_25005 [Vicinamibacterales bacterium]
MGQRLDGDDEIDAVREQVVEAGIVVADDEPAGVAETAARRLGLERGRTAPG